MEKERLLNVNEAAARLHVHKTTIYKLIKAGQLQAVKLSLGTGQRVTLRFSENELTRFIERAETAEKEEGE